LAKKLRVAHLYPKLMNIYGDRGNILCLKRRCEERKLDFDLEELSVGDKLKADRYDLIFIGGAQDREQRRVADDLIEVKGEALREAVDDRVVVLAVCGGYQLMGRHYVTAEGAELPGVGLLDMWTAHPGEGADRFIGNIVVEWSGGTLVGFENHGGRTHLGDGARPLGRVVYGYGNNGEDSGEGAVRAGVFGTYLHGSLLPKNPKFADHVIQRALSRRYDGIELDEIDDRVEEAAHSAAVQLATGRSTI
jgi:CobQ-like glutamine amidotransferase family enzyme